MPKPAHGMMTVKSDAFCQAAGGVCKLEGVRIGCMLMSACRVPARAFECQRSMMCIINLRYPLSFHPAVKQRRCWGYAGEKRAHFLPRTRCKGISHLGEGWDATLEFSREIPDAPACTTMHACTHSATTAPIHMQVTEFMAAS